MKCTNIYKYTKAINELKKSNYHKPMQKNKRHRIKNIDISSIQKIKMEVTKDGQNGENPCGCIYIYIYIS